MAKRKRSSNKKRVANTSSLKESSSTTNQIHDESSCVVKLGNNSTSPIDGKLTSSMDSSLPVTTSKNNFTAGRRLNFEEKLDKFIAQSCFTQPFRNSAISNLSSSGNAVDDVNAVISKVRSLELLPSVYVYTIEHEGHGISAVDVDQSRTHFAYSLADSSEIQLLTWENDYDFHGNVNDLWSKYVATEIQENEFKKRKTTVSLQSQQLHLIQHNAAVTSLQFTTDSDLLLSSSLDGSVKVYSTNSHCVMEHYDGFGYIFDIDVSFDSTHFATASVLSRYVHSENIASLYNFENTEPVMTFLGHKDAVKCVRFHPNGLYIATASFDKTIKLWNTRTSKEVRKFEDKNCQDPPQKLAFSPDGKYLASTYSGCVKIWDLASGKILKCLETLNSEPNNLSICYNALGNILATGDSSGRILFWNMKSDGSSLMKPETDIMKSEDIGKRIYSIKYTSNFFSCVTG